MKFKKPKFKPYDALNLLADIQGIMPRETNLAGKKRQQFFYDLTNLINDLNGKTIVDPFHTIKNNACQENEKYEGNYQGLIG